MPWILSDVVSLTQYLTIFSKVEFNKERCSHCGKLGLWRHGCYPRKADRSSESTQSANPIYIQRYYCPNCQRTESVLPECLPHRRWYLWEIQQAALSLLLAGKSLRAIEQQVTPSRRTIGRWVNRFKERVLIHKDTLCNHIIDLGRTNDFTVFWQVCLRHLSLAKAMRLCHVAGVFVP